jgi:1,4-alpha-glucan branching enzyme
MIRKEHSPIADCVRVTFEVPASAWADHIYLVGDFNNWDRRTLPFQRARNGVWRITIDLPARKRFEFRYLIDDHWCTDSHADGYAKKKDRESNSFVETTLPIENVADTTGHGMVHEAAVDSGLDFTKKRHQ